MTVKNKIQLDELLCFAIYSTNLEVTSAYKPILAELGLTYPQYVVMVALWQEDCQSVTVLAEHVHMDVATLSPLLKRLEVSGYVTRTRLPEDERRVQVSLTTKGLATKRKASEIGDAFGNACALTGKDIQSLRSGLQKLRDHLHHATE